MRMDLFIRILNCILNTRGHYWVSTLSVLSMARKQNTFGRGLRCWWGWTLMHGASWQRGWGPGASLHSRLLTIYSFKCLQENRIPALCHQAKLLVLLWQKSCLSHWDGISMMACPVPLFSWWEGAGSPAPASSRAQWQLPAGRRPSTF